MSEREEHPTSPTDRVRWYHEKTSQNLWSGSGTDRKTEFGSPPTTPLLRIAGFEAAAV